MEMFVSGSGLATVMFVPCTFNMLYKYACLRKKFTISQRNYFICQLKPVYFMFVGCH